MLKGFNIVYIHFDQTEYRLYLVPMSRSKTKERQILIGIASFTNLTPQAESDLTD